MKLNNCILKLTMAFLLMSNLNALSQESESKVNFEFVIMTTKDEIKMECNYGCNWKKLSFNSKETAFDENGMEEMAHEFIINGDTKFFIVMRRLTDEILLRGLQGTAWKELKFKIKRNRKYVISNSGVIEEKK